MWGNCSLDQAVGPILGEGSDVLVCSEERNLKWGQASSLSLEEVTFKVNFDLRAVEAALLFLPHLSLSPFPLSRSSQRMPENIFQREHLRLSRAHHGALCEYLVQMLSTASPVMLFINCNARATDCDSVARTDFIDVNKRRRGLIQTLRLSMTALFC